MIQRTTAPVLSIVVFGLFAATKAVVAADEEALEIRVEEATLRSHSAGVYADGFVRLSIRNHRRAPIRWVFAERPKFAVGGVTLQSIKLRNVCLDVGRCAKGAPSLFSKLSAGGAAGVDIEFLTIVHSAAGLATARRGSITGKIGFIDENDNVTSIDFPPLSFDVENHF